MREIVNRCPVCNAESREFTLYKKCPDFSITRESFSIDECQKCYHLFTNPRPTVQNIGNYYDSAAYVSHSDTDQGIINKLYKVVRKATLSKKNSFVRSLSPQGSALLDVGCGTGYFLESCQKSGWEVTGVEQDPRTRKKAEEKINKKVFQNLEEVPEYNKYDIITLWHVLEHLYDLHKSIQKISSLLTDQGKIIIAVPNPDAYDAVFYQKYWAAYDVPRHLHHFRQNVLEELVGRNGLKIRLKKGMPLDAFYVAMLSEKYRKGKTNFAGLRRAAEIGIKSNIEAYRTTEYSSIIYVCERVDREAIVNNLPNK